MTPWNGNQVVRAWVPIPQFQVWWVESLYWRLDLSRVLFGEGLLSVSISTMFLLLWDVVKKGQYSKNRLFVCTLCTCRLCSMKYIISPLGSPERESLTGIKGRCRERQRISSKKFIATVYSEWGSLGNWIWFLLRMISELFAFLEQEQVFWKKIPP